MDRGFKNYICYIGPDASGSQALLCVGPRGEPRVTGNASRGLSESLDQAFQRQPPDVQRIWLGRIKEAIEVGQSVGCDRRKMQALRIAESFIGEAMGRAA